MEIFDCVIEIMVDYVFFIEEVFVVMVVIVKLKIIVDVICVGILVGFDNVVVFVEVKKVFLEGSIFVVCVFYYCLKMKKLFVVKVLVVFMEVCKVKVEFKFVEYFVKEWC